jgi:lysophospholipase L1-like esterase
MFTRRSFINRLALATAAAVAAVAGNFALPPAAPVAHAGVNTKDGGRHNEFNALAKKGGYDVVFLGDSLTHYWMYEGKDVWEREIKPLKAVNFGIGAETTDHVESRIQNGNFDGKAHPKVIVLLIGTNNNWGPRRANPNPSAEKTAAGIKRVINRLQLKQPDAKILLVSLLPLRDPTDPWLKLNKATNPLIAKFADNQKIFFLDIFDKFLDTDGDIKANLFKTRTRKRQGIEPVHLSSDGYAVLAKNIVPKVRELLALPR